MRKRGSCTGHERAHIGWSPVNVAVAALLWLDASVWDTRRSSRYRASFLMLIICLSGERMQPRAPTRRLHSIKRRCRFPAQPGGPRDLLFLPDASRSPDADGGLHHGNNTVVFLRFNFYCGWKKPLRYLYRRNLSCFNVFLLQRSFLSKFVVQAEFSNHRWIMTISHDELLLGS